MTQMNDNAPATRTLREEELTARVKDTVIAVLELDISREQLTEDTSLYSSFLGMDSMTLLHLLVTLEQEFGIEIDDEDVMNAEMKKVGSLIDLVGRLVVRDGAR
ncbi:acyl carrier protein [Saccharopolyspora spinosa]|uniref:Acyl carrier protein n=1 Tax=Saccharopolyspora spinosa TaxID=60894 RepID=A0A2N3Y0W3_SACSN|nr:acyl carrier protein [Saccharopolyspora spinosa]PKW16556.1 acyl carrier protein [Saccharopolyspora spinosa]